MFKHIVCWTLKDEAAGATKNENLVKMKKVLEDMIGKVEVLKFLEVGINSERAADSNYDIVLITEFEKFEDLKIYDEHPVHQKVKEFVKQVAEKRVAVDYEI